MSRYLAIALVVSSASTAFALPPTEPWDPPPTIITKSLCTGLINAKVQQLAAQGTNLGSSTSGVNVVSAAFCWQSFQNGRIHTGTTSSSTTYAITGAVLAKFIAVGAEGLMGKALEETPESGIRNIRFTRGHIVVHPTWGTRVILGEHSSLWEDNQQARRFGYPTADGQANAYSTGAYSLLERGYVASNDDMDTWIDFTGTGEGRVTASANVFQDARFVGTKLSRSLASESPVLNRAQFGTLDNAVSSLSLVMPTRASLYIYDSSPAQGRYVRITGADNATINVSNIGTFMNDRPSSMILVNHGTASAKTTLADLTRSIKTGLASFEATAPVPNGTLRWNDDLEVTLWPGERVLQFTRSAYIDINADCALVFNCNADGNVQFSFAVRPHLTMIPDTNHPGQMRPSVHVWVVDATAVSLSCTGRGCSERDTALATLFDTTAMVDTIRGPFDASFDASTLALSGLEGCPGVNLKRVNVLPDAIELVVGDTAAAGSCLTGPLTAGLIETTRPVASVTNGALNIVPAPFTPPLVVLPFDGTVSVVPDLGLPNPPPVQK